MNTPTYSPKINSTMRSAVLILCLAVTTSFSAPSWLDTVFGYQDPYSSPANDYNGYEQAPYTVTQQYQVGVDNNEGDICTCTNYYVTRDLSQGSILGSTGPAPLAPTCSTPGRRTAL